MGLLNKRKYRLTKKSVTFEGRAKTQGLTNLNEKIIEFKKDLEFSISKNSISMSNSPVKENANQESKNENEGVIQDELRKCKHFIDSLCNIPKYHSNKIIMAHINIKSLRNKFDILTNSVTDHIDILMISEYKLDNFFWHALYHLKEFSNTHRLDGNSYGGGILVYAGNNIPSDLVKPNQKSKNFEDFFIESELSQKRFLSYSYNPHKDNTN